MLSPKDTPSPQSATGSQHLTNEQYAALPEPIKALKTFKVGQQGEDEPKVTFAGCSLREILLSGGKQLTVNQFVDRLYEVEFTTENKAKLTVQMAFVLAAIECVDHLDQEHKERLISIARLSFARGLEIL